MKKKKMTITPDMAVEWLENVYSEQRRVHWNNVMQIARDIQNGKWNASLSEIESPICVSPNGEILNGQHRLWACIESKMPIETWVYFDVPVELFKLMDGSTKRTPADVNRHIKNANSICALAKYVCALEQGVAPLASTIQKKLSQDNGRVIYPTKQDINEIIAEKEDELQKFYNLSVKASTHVGKKYTTVSEAFYTLDYLGKGQCLDAFAEECAMPVPEAQAIISCRTYMTTQLMKPNFKASPQWIFGCFFRTYDAYVAGEIIGAFNKVNLTFSKYDKLVRAERKRRATK